MGVSFLVACEQRQRLFLLSIIYFYKDVHRGNSLEREIVPQEEGAGLFTVQYNKDVSLWSKGQLGLLPAHHRRFRLPTCRVPRP